MSSDFIELARLGKTEWWRFLLGMLIVVVSWVGVGAVCELALVYWSLMAGESTVSIDPTSGPVVGVEPLFTYVVLNLGHVVMLIALYVVVRRLHRRPFLSLVTAAAGVDWKRLGQGFGLWLALLCLACLVDYLIHPSTYRVSLKPARFLLFLPVVLILTPIQTSAEEILCRGYLLQGVGLLSRNRWVIALVTGVLFMLPHLANPEVVTGFWPMATYYLSVGVFLALVTLKSNSLELALGMHAATCLFNALICNYAHSVLDTESIFFCTELEPYSNLVSFLVIAVVFYWVFLGRPQKRATGTGSLGPAGSGVEDTVTT